MDNRTTKYFAFTLNNYQEENIQRIQNFAKNDKNIYHLIFGYEEAPSTGTKHLQGAFSLKNRSRASTLKNLIGITELHIEPCRKIYEANINYCKKTENYWEFPENFIRKSPNNNNKKRQTYTEAYELAKEGKFDQIDAEKMIKYDQKFKKIFAESKTTECLYLDNRYGNFFKDFFLFAHGPTGTGKSFRVEDIVYTLNEWWKDYCTDRNLPFRKLTLYRKKCNKWWDGYLGEEIVIIEELQPGWCSLAGGHLKIWLDQYVFSGEFKGGTIEKMRPKWFILTSNYTLEQLFTDKEGKVITEDLHPIQRRVYSVTVNNKNDNIYWPNLDSLSLYFDTIETVRSEILNQFHNNYLIRKEKYIQYQNNKELNLHKEDSIENLNASLTQTTTSDNQLLPSDENIIIVNYCEFKFEFENFQYYEEYCYNKKCEQILMKENKKCLKRINSLRKEIELNKMKLQNLNSGYELIQSFTIDGEIFTNENDKSETLNYCIRQILTTKNTILNLEQEIQHNYNIYFFNLPEIKKYRDIIESLIVNSNKKQNKQIIEKTPEHLRINDNEQ